MKAVLISIQPKWVEQIANGKKTIEVRKSRTKLKTPFKCLIYATQPKKWFRYSSFGRASDESLWLSKGKVKMSDGFEFWAYEGKDYECLNGKVIGEFICDRIDEYDYDQAFDESMGCYIDKFGYAITSEELKRTCLSYEELEKYGNTNRLYGLHITDLKIYDKPKELSEFRKYCGMVERFEVESVEFFEYCYNCPNLVETDSGLCSVDCGNRLKRPPQSCCYVEELQE